MPAIHIVRFKLNADVAEKDFLAVNEQFQREAATTLSGLERREACRGPEGEWMLVLRYRDAASAKQQGAPSDAGKRLMGMIDKKTMISSLYEVVTP
jgi:hypothetical protein